MKKTMALMLALMMILTSVSFAAPSMVSTVTTSQEIQAKEQKLPEEQLLLNEDAVNHIDETYGTLLYDIDFETEDAFVTEQHPSKQGYVNPDFSADTWKILTSGMSTDTNYAPVKVIEGENTFLRMYNGDATNCGFSIYSNSTTEGSLTTDNGYYTVFADIRATISGSAGADYKQFFAQMKYPSGDVKVATNGTTGSWVTTTGLSVKTGEVPLRRINYYYGYNAKSTKNVDIFDIDNIKLYYKPFSVDVTVEGNAQLGIADKTVTVNIGEDLDSTITKEELMAMLTYEGGTILKDLTLADGSAFTSIDVVELQNVKGVFEKVEWLDDTYGYLVYNIDFETKDAFVTEQHPSKQGYVNPDFSADTWKILTSGMSTDTNYAPVKVIEGENTFLRMYNGDATNCGFSIYSNSTTEGSLTTDNGYYTVFADIRATISGSAGADYKQFFAQMKYPSGDVKVATNGTTGSWVTTTGLSVKTGEVPLRRINYYYGYNAKSTKNVDIFDIDNIKLYYKPFSVDVTVEGNAQLGIADKTVTVNIGEDLDSTITKTELMALVENDTDLILCDITLPDGTAFTSIDVMKVTEVKAVWDDKNPESYNVSSIRVNNPAGIRFRASVTTEQKKIAAEYGFIITLEKHLGEKDASVLTIDSDIKKVTGVSYGYDPKAEKDVDRIYEIEGNNIFFTAAVYGMPETKESYSENIVVRPYLKDADGKYHYAEPIIRSVIDVAIAIRDGGYTTVDEKGKAYVQNILDICGEEI